MNAARAVGYVGAGTVEFIFDCDTDKFYFMEMNTRLQVEHPVTEMITGQDLVAWQLRVAAGGTLPLKQHELAINGHAFEARIYAENPRRGFLPHTGRLHHLIAPTASANVRVDTGVRFGDAVSIYYDPMIAKLIVWDVDRAAALRRMRVALADYQIVGLPNNVEFLQNVVTNADFVAGKVDTTFIKQHGATLLPARPTVPAQALVSVALFDALVAPSTNDASYAWRARSVRFNHEHARVVTLGCEAIAASVDALNTSTVHEAGAVTWHRVHVRERGAAHVAALHAASPVPINDELVDVRIGDDVNATWIAASVRHIEKLASGAARITTLYGNELFVATVVPHGENGNKK